MNTIHSLWPISERIRWLCADLTVSFRRNLNPSSRMCGADIRKSAEEHLEFLCKRWESLTSEKVPDADYAQCREVIRKAASDFDEATAALCKDAV